VANPRDEAEWRAEFERYGEDQTREALSLGQFPETKRQLAFRWLGDQAIARRVREEQTYKYARWTFFVAVAAVVVGIVGIVVTIASVWVTVE
jgi:hypothetical protein